MRSMSARINAIVGRKDAMRIGRHGETRPADVIANSVHVMRVATGEAEEG